MSRDAKKPSWGRRLLRWAGLVALLLVIALLVALRVVANGERLARIVQDQINDRIRGKVEIGSIEWPLRSLPKVVTGGWIPVTIREITVWDDTEDNAQVLYAKSARASIHTHSAIFGRNDLVLRDVAIDEGGWALIKQVPEPFPLHDYDRFVVSLVSAFYGKDQRAGFRAGIPAQSMPVFDIRDVTVGGPGVELEFQFPTFQARLEGARLPRAFLYANRSDPLSDKMYFSLSAMSDAVVPAPVTAEGGWVEAADVRVELGDVRVETLRQQPNLWPADPIAHDVEWRATAVTAEGASILAAGRLANYWTTIFGGDYDIALEVDHAGPLVHRVTDGLAAGDDLRLRVDITGPGLAPKIAVQIFGLDVAVPVADLPPIDLHLPRVAAAFDLATESGYLEDTVARGAGGEVQLSASFSINPYLFDLYVAITEPLLIAPYLPPDVRALAGVHLRGRLHAFGNNTVQRIDRLDLWLGQAHLQGTLYRNEQGVLHAERLLAQLGKTAVNARGVINPEAETFDLYMTYSSRDLARFLRHFGVPSIATGVDGSAHVDGSFDDPRASTRVSATGVPIIDRVMANLGYHRDVITLRDARGRPMDGTVTASGRLRRGPVPTVLQFDARAEDLDLSRAPIIGRFLGGRLQATAAARGRIDRIDADLDATATDLTIAGDSYEGLRVTARGDADGTYSAAIQLERPAGGSLAAQATLDRAQQLGGAISLRALPLETLAALSGAEQSPVGGIVSAELQLGGTPEAPTVDGTVSLARSWIGSAFLGSADLHLERVGPAQVRLTGDLFQGRLRVDGTVETRAPYEADLTVDLRRLELDHVVPELAAATGARAWVSGRVRLRAPLEPVPGREPQLDAHLTEAVVLIDNEDADGRPAPIRLANRTPLDIRYDGHTAHLLQTAVFRGPAGDVSVSGSGSLEALALQVRGDIAVRLLEPYLRDYFDELSGTLAVEVEVRGSADDVQIAALIDIDDLAAKPAGQDAIISIPSGLVQLTNEQLSFTGVRIFVDDPFSDERSSLVVLGGLRLRDSRPDAWALHIDGQLSGKLLLVAAPQSFSQAGGMADVSVAVSGPGASPNIDGTLSFATDQPLTFTPRGLRRELTLTAGAVTFTDQLIELDGIAGVVDEEGRIDSIRGEISLENWRPVDMHVIMSADSLPFRVPQTLDLTLAVRDLEIVGALSQLYIGGTVEILDGRFIRNFNLIGEAIRPQRTAETDTPFYEEVPFLADAQLGLRLETRAFFVQNNIARNVELNGNIDVTGSPRNPRFDGVITVDQGTFKLQGMRASFTRTSGSVSFLRYHSFPEETPVLDIRSEADFRDRSGQDHLIQLVIQGPLEALRWDLSTNTGLNRGQTAQLIFAGKTPDELRATLGDQGVGRDPIRTDRAAQTTGVADQIVKDMAADFLSLIFEERLRDLTDLDVARLEIGTASIGFHVEKGFFKSLRMLGDYEQNVRGRFIDVRVQLRLHDLTSVETEYHNRRFTDDSEEDRSDLRFQVVRRIPLLP